MTKFKVGDKVRITEDLFPRLIGKVGQIIKDDGSIIPYLVVLENGEGCWKHAENIELLKDSPSTHSEHLVLTRLFHAEAEVDKMSRSIDELKLRIETLGKEKADKPKFDTFTSGMLDKATARFAESVRRSLQTPNQRRAIVIKRAEAYVGDLRGRAMCGFNRDGNFTFNHLVTKLTFHVNAEKGVVVALAHGANNGVLIRKAFARCAPGDVFNDKIGMAIAAGRLFGVVIPKEYLDAPQPTEPVVGMRVKSNLSARIYDVTRFCDDEIHTRSYGRPFRTAQNPSGWVGVKQVTITDDSEAVYE